MKQIKDYNDVMDLSASITYELEESKLIKGNSKTGNYNFDVDDAIREVLCRKFNIKED